MNLQNVLMHTCAWCESRIEPDEEVFGFGAKVGPTVVIEDKQGEFVSLELSLIRKTVFAVIPLEGSPARQAGYDLLFVTCSVGCAEELKAALDLEKHVFDR